MYELMFDGLFRSTVKQHKAGFMCIGWVLFQHEVQIGQGYGVIGRGRDATSNIAEYLALIDGLQAIIDLGIRHQPVRVVGDARVVIEQMQGRSKISTSRVMPMHRHASKLACRLNQVEWLWVPRRRNKIADRLTRRALREMLDDPQLYKEARAKVLQDNERRWNRFLDFGGMMVLQPQRSDSRTPAWH